MSNKHTAPLAAAIALAATLPAFAAPANPRLNTIPGVAEKPIAVELDHVRIDCAFRPSKYNIKEYASFSVTANIPRDPYAAQFVHECFATAYREASGCKIPFPTGFAGLSGAYKAEYVKHLDYYANNGTITAGKDGEPASDFSFVWELDLSSDLKYADENVLSFGVSCWTYFGGIHPCRHYWNGSYLRKQKRRMRVSDLFERKHLADVMNLIRVHIGETTNNDLEYLRKNYAYPIEVPSYVDYAKEYKVKVPGCSYNPTVTEHFMLLEEGIVWTFNVYELGGYGTGDVNSIVPWKKLKPYLKTLEYVPKSKLSGAFLKAVSGAKEDGKTLSVGSLVFF